MPSVLLSNVLQCLELPRCHRASTDIPNPALLNNIVERLHDLLPWRTTVKTVDLQDVDIRAEALDALLDRVEDVLTAETNLVDHFAVVSGNRCDAEGWVLFIDAEVAFGEEHELVAWNTVLLDGFGNDLLGDAMRVDIGLKRLIVSHKLHRSYLLS